MILARAERLTKLVTAVMVLTVTGVLWGARLEWSSQDHEKRIGTIEADSKEYGRDIATLKATRKEGGGGG
jgi:hypothetical protein